MGHGRSLHTRAGAAALLIGVAACAHDGDGVTDLAGRRVDPLSGPAKVTVLVFVSTDCPVSNRTVPELERVRARFEPQGVAFWLVYPTREESPAAITAHLHDYGLTSPAIRDPRHSLVARAHVTVTPESAVFRGAALAYHGRIDDRQIDLGDSRPEVTRHDLSLALEAVLAGRPAPEAPGAAIGCAISAER